MLPGIIGINQHQNTGVRSTIHPELICGLVIGLVGGSLLLPNPMYWAICAGLGVLTSWVTRSWIAPLLIPVMSIAGIGTTLFAAASIGWWRIGINSAWVLIAASTTAVGISLFWRRRGFGSRGSWGQTLTIALVSIPWLWYQERLPWDSADALRIISNFEEDNGSWLHAMKEIVERDGVFHHDGNYSIIGWPGAVIVTLVFKLHSSIMLTGDDSLYVALLNVRMYWLLMWGICLLAASYVAMKLERNVSTSVLVTASSCAGFIVLSYGLSLTYLGHVTALLATLFALTAITLLDVGSSVPDHENVTFSIVLLFGLLLVVSIGASWTPALMLSALWIVGVGFIAFINVHSKHRTKLLSASAIATPRRFWFRAGNQSRRAYAARLGGVFALSFSFVVLVYVVRTIGSVSYVINQMSLGGAFAEVSPELALITIICAISLVIATIKSDDRLWRSSALLVVLIGLSPIALFLLSYLVEPYGPNYGAGKWLHMSALILSPAATVAITMAVRRKTTPRINAIFIVSAVLLSPFVMAWEPYIQVHRLFKKVEPAWWAEGAIREIRKYPDRTVLCLDTRRDQWTGGPGYSCTRILGGLQGKTGQLTNVWASGNICGTSPESLKAVTRSEWQRVTVIVTDATRLTSAISCDDLGWTNDDAIEDPKNILGWLTYVKWKDVRIIDSNGESVEKSFNYLQRETQYTPQLIDELNAALQL